MSPKSKPKDMSHDGRTCKARRHANQEFIGFGGVVMGTLSNGKLFGDPEQC